MGSSAKTSSFFLTQVLHNSDKVTCRQRFLVLNTDLASIKSYMSIIGRGRAREQGGTCSDYNA